MLYVDNVDIDVCISIIWKLYYFKCLKVNMEKFILECNSMRGYYCCTLLYPDGTKLDEYCDFHRNENHNREVAMLLERNKHTMKRYCKNSHSNQEKK